MQTSALSFHQILKVASSFPNQQAQFLQVLADKLGLRGHDAQAQVLSILLVKMAETKADIEKLPVDEEGKEHLRTQLMPFNVISNLSQVHLKIQHAKQHFLKVEALDGLLNIHLALSGHVARKNIEAEEAANLAQKFRDIAKEIQDEDLPEIVKRALLKRTLQMATILDHYYAFGPDDLKGEIDGIVGAIILSGPPPGSKVNQLFKEIAKLTAAAYLCLTVVEAGLSKAVSITENASKLIEYYEAASDDG